MISRVIFRPPKAGLPKDYEVGLVIIAQTDQLIYNTAMSWPRILKHPLNNKRCEMRKARSHINFHKGYFEE